MSSRTGPRASGTDGSDFSHREKVASHYRDSVRWKSKLKLNLSLHLFFVFLGALWTGLGYMKVVQHQAQDWQMVWLCSIIPVLSGLNSLPKNKHNQMYVYVIGSVVLGLGPVIYGTTKYIKTLIENLGQDANKSFDVQGLSIKLAIIGLVVQMQVTSIYYAIRLINAWKSKGEKKRS